MATSEQEVIKPKRFRRGLCLGPPHAVNGQSIEEMPLPERLFVPLKQHRGAWCQPKVAVGDRVLLGQVIGENTDPESAPVHSPVSGKVTAIGDHVDAYGQAVPTVTIENDGLDEWFKAPVEDPGFMDKKISAMIRAVRESGVVKAYGGRPVYAMLAPPERPKAYIFLVGIPVVKPVELLLVNAMDPEPIQAVNRRLLLDEPEALAAGAALIKKIVGARQAMVAVDEDVSEAGPALSVLANSGVSSVRLRNRYPVARQELLTTAVTGRELPWPDGDPRDVGVLVFDAGSVMAILDAVRSGRPQIDRVITVTGPEMTPRNFRVRLGTPIKDVIAFAGGSFDRAGKVVVGCLMDGQAQYSGLVPVTKLTEGVHVLGADELVHFDEQLCIKCGKCVAVCPMRLLPNVITNFCEFGHFNEAVDAELFKCIECGCCAYVCPAKRPLVHYIKHGKAEVTAMRTAL